MSEVPLVCLSLIVAAAQNGTIGKDGSMPWHLRTDLKRFRQITMGKPVIMGRKTYLSIGRALPGRSNIVMTRHMSFSAQHIICAHSFDEALILAHKQARQDGENEIFVIGGADIFTLALPQVEKIYFTKILAPIEGDVFFPPLDSNLWHILSSEEIPMGEEDTYPTRFIIYQRR